MRFIQRDWGVTISPSLWKQLTDYHPRWQERVAFAFFTSPRTEAFFAWNGLTSSGLGGKLRYWLGNIFPHPPYMRERYRIKYDWLLPVYYGWRICKGIYLNTISLIVTLGNLVRS